MIADLGEEATENRPRRPSVRMLEDMFAAKGLLMVVQFHIFFLPLLKKATYYSCTFGESCILFKVVVHC